MISTIALVGADGAGKTTLAKKLLEVSPRPMKYLYMGISIESSNFALPTSRLIWHLKRRAYEKSAGHSEVTFSDSTLTHQIENRQVKRGKIAATARLLSRLAEECFRQTISWVYQLRGYIVLYDRHFLFEYASQSVNTQIPRRRLSDRVHLWFLHHVYPQPDLTILLDAPPEVLRSRKNGCTLEHLEREREAYIQQGKKMSNCVLIDATQPLENILADVSQLITASNVPVSAARAA